MTKKEIIEKIQEQEASYWRNWKFYNNVFGGEHELTKILINQWSVIDDLIKELGIETKREEA